MNKAKKKRKLRLALLTILSLIVLGVNTVIADEPKPNEITEIISPSETIIAGTEFELIAVISPARADDDYLRWEITGDEDIIRFDDEDRDDNEMEFIALKEGTTEVRCYIIGKSEEYAKTFTVTVEDASTAISSKGKKNVTVEIGDDIELEVSKGKELSYDDLKWTIEDTSILRFDDRRQNGTEVELDAINLGTTTVTCENLISNTKITYEVTVVPDYHD